LYFLLPFIFATSKTCGNCGNIKQDLGASKVYKCSECKKKMYRDVNGARNILLKNINLIQK
jgi:putative transposase